MEEENLSLLPSTISGVRISVLQAIAEEEFDKLLPLVNTYLEDKGDEIRSGGYLSVNCPGYPIALLSSRFGRLTAAKAPKYNHYATVAKIDQLEENPEHFSSYQSRDPSPVNWQDQRWGGAIKIFLNGFMYISFSGLPELADEALCLRIAFRLGASLTEINAIAAHSQNPWLTTTGEFQLPPAA